MFRFAENENAHRYFENTQKEILTRFWCEVFTAGFHGEKAKVPISSNNDVRGPEALYWQAIGKILSHFMLLYKILPVRFCRSALYHIFSPNADLPDEVLLNDFLLFVTETENSLLRRCLNSCALLPAADEDALRRLFCRYDMHTEPHESSAERKKQLVHIARSELITKPSYYYGLMRNGIPDKYTSLVWKNITLPLLTSIYKRLTPTSDDVVRQLRIFTSGGKVVELNRELQVLPKEKFKVLYYLLQAIHGFDTEMLSKFLQLLTGTDLMTMSPILVNFKSYKKNFLKFNKCNSTIELTETFCSQQELNDEIYRQLRSSHYLED